MNEIPEKTLRELKHIYSNESNVLSSQRAVKIIKGAVVEARKEAFDFCHRLHEEYDEGKIGYGQFMTKRDKFLSGKKE